MYESLLKQDNIENPDGYIYRIAKNVYARYIDGRKQITAVDGLEYVPYSKDFTQINVSQTLLLLQERIGYEQKGKTVSPG